MIGNPGTLTYGKHQPSPSCHFLPLYFLWRDGEPMAMSILQCPCPLERSPQVIKGVACGPELRHWTNGKPTGCGLQMGTGALPVFVLVLYKEGKVRNLVNEGRVTFIARDKMLTEHRQAIVESESFLEASYRWLDLCFVQ